MFKVVIKVWCLAERHETTLRGVHKGIVSTLGRQRIGVRSEKDVLVLFPADLMSYGLGQDIFIEGKFLQELGDGNQTKFDGVSYALQDFFSRLYPNAKVACLVNSFDNKFTSRCFSH